MIYKTQDVCSKEIHIEMENGVIKEVSFMGGCPGNLKGISQLVKGRKPQEVIDILNGIACGNRSTSCPDQLALALKELV